MGISGLDIPGKRDYKTTAVFILVLIGSILNGCGLFHMNGMSINDWTPRSEYVGDIRTQTLSLSFSEPMDRVSAEESFTLSCDGDQVAGNFFWQERKMMYVPYEPLLDNRIYTMEVSTVAEDIYGNNLASNFLHTFSSITEDVRPYVLSVSPENETSTGDPHQPIIIDFSEPVDCVSVYGGFSISPLISGAFSWEESNARCTFTPNESMAWGEQYILIMDESIEDLSGNRLGTDYTFTFTVGTDTDPPGVLKAMSNEDVSFSLQPDNPEDSFLYINQNWETFWNIRLKFDEPVTRGNFKSHITIKPGTDYEIPASSDEFLDVIVIEFESRPVFDTVYTLTLDENIADSNGNTLGDRVVYRFRTNGPGSTPPAVELVRFSSTIGSPTGIVTCGAFDNINLTASAGPADEYFDVYISIADNAGILKKDFIDNFSVSSSDSADCISVSIFGVKISPASPAPDPLPQPEEIVVRIYAEVETFTGPGILTFKLESDFSDSAGNTIPEAWMLQTNIINN